MADPFSVAGTAVGITSLGIQTCQILYNYYSKYKGYHDDIDNVLKQVEGLQGILESLRQVMERLEIDNHGPSSQLHMAFKACEEALARLKIMADKCNTTKQAEGIQSRLRDVQKRLSWPYRKGTLADMQATLNGFQDNLSLALQCAGIDGVVRKLEDLHPKVTNMEQSLIGQSGVLEVIHRGMADVSRAQHQHDMTLSREMHDLRDHISACTTIVSSKVELVARSVSGFHDPALIAPSLLSDALQTLEDVQPHVQSSLESYNAHSLEVEKFSASPGRLSLCQCRTKKKQTLQRRRWMAILSAETYQHDPGCPQFASSDYMRSIAAQFVVYNKFLRVCVQVGWQSSRTKGWSTIAPMLIYRAVVPEDTGVFKIFYDAHNDIVAALRSATLKERHENGRQILLRTTATLQVTLGTEFSPYDTRQDGAGVLHAAMDLVRSLKWYSPRGDYIDETQSLLDMCLTRGAPFDQPNASGFTPIVQWQVYMHTTGMRYTGHHNLRHLVQRVGEWSIYDPHYILYGSVPSLHDSLSELLKSEEICSALDEDDHLYITVMRQSDIDFDKVVTAQSGEDMVRKLEKPKYLFALAAWPRGIGILVSKGLANNVGTLATSLWRTALDMKVVRSMVALLPLKLQITKADWVHANRIIYYSKPRGVERTEWAHIFDTLACLLSPRNDDLASIQDHGSSNIDKNEKHLYNCRLSVLGAESLWKLGHRNVNSVRCRFNDNECDNAQHFDTPLWFNAENYPSYGWKQQLPFFRWLLEHGAHGSWIHPTYLSTPVHLLVRYLARVAVGVNSIAPLEEVDDFLLQEQPDHCVCHCSLKGCRVIGSVMCVKDWRYLPTSWTSRMRFFRECTQPYLFQIVQKNRAGGWMSSAILRVLTFDELSLTHTCCYRAQEEIYDKFHRPTLGEAQIIYELEREDIELLEILTTEFELKWATYTKPFVTFMNRVWKPRMRAIRAERRVDKDVYEAELQRIGVTLKHADEEKVEEVVSNRRKEYVSDSESDSDWPDDYESEGDGWYTTDEEDGEVVDEDETLDEEADQSSADATDDLL